MSNYNKKSRKPLTKSMKGGESETVVVSNNSKYANIEPVMLKPLEVVVYNNGFDRALRAFRALVQKERILSSYKERQTYEKPSVRRRRKRNEMKRKVLDFDSNKDTSKKVFKKKKVAETSDKTD
jgi:small subunit ribosomal protein S21